MRSVVGPKKCVRLTEVSVNSRSRMVFFPLNNAIFFWVDLIRLAVWTGNNLKRHRPKKNVTVWALSPFFSEVGLDMYLQSLTEQAFTHPTFFNKDWYFALRTCLGNIGHEITQKSVGPAILGKNIDIMRFHASNGRLAPPRWRSISGNPKPIKLSTAEPLSCQSRCVRRSHSVVLSWHRPVRVLQHGRSTDPRLHSESLGSCGLCI